MRSIKLTQDMGYKIYNKEKAFIKTTLKNDSLDIVNNIFTDMLSSEELQDLVKCKYVQNHYSFSFDTVIQDNGNYGKLVYDLKFMDLPNLKSTYKKALPNSHKLYDIIGKNTGNIYKINAQSYYIAYLEDLKSTSTSTDYLKQLKLIYHSQKDKINILKNYDAAFTKNSIRSTGMVIDLFPSYEPTIKSLFSDRIANADKAAIVYAGRRKKRIANYKIELKLLQKRKENSVADKVKLEEGPISIDSNANAIALALSKATLLNV